MSGAVNLVFAGRPLTNTYRNLTNVVLRIAPTRAADRPAVLVNAHFDRRSLHSTSLENFWRTPSTFCYVWEASPPGFQCAPVQHQPGPCCLSQHASALHLRKRPLTVLPACSQGLL